MALALCNLHYPVPFTDRPTPVGIASVHSPMFNRVNRLDVARATACINVASVVNVFLGGAVQRLEHETMNLSQPAFDPDMAISIAVFRGSPNPTLAVSGKVSVEADEIAMCEHKRSIQMPGFIASAGSVEDESAVPEGNAP